MKPKTPPQTPVEPCVGTVERRSPESRVRARVNDLTAPPAPWWAEQDKDQDWIDSHN